MDGLPDKRKEVSKGLSRLRRTCSPARALASRRAAADAEAAAQTQARNGESNSSKSVNDNNNKRRSRGKLREGPSENKVPTPVDDISGERTISADTCLLESEVRLLALLYDKYEHAKWGTKEEEKDKNAPSNMRNLADRDPLAALNALHERIGTRRGEEHTWLDLPFVMVDDRSRAYLKGVAYRPIMPASWKMNPNEWLSNRDIHQVLIQYEDRCPDFAFLGVHPIDFATVLKDGLCVSIDMCQLDVARLWHQGKRQLGIVFNTDKHYQSGSHWVCCYINIDPSPTSHFFGMFYYDSVQNSPPAEVRVLFEKVWRQVHDLFGIDAQDGMNAVREQTRGGKEDDHNAGNELTTRRREFVFEVNKVRRQFKNTECGVFAMLFLVCCISKQFSCEHVCKSMGRDEHVQELRNILFRSE